MNKFELANKYIRIPNAFIHASNKKDKSRQWGTICSEIQNKKPCVKSMQLVHVVKIRAIYFGLL